MTVCDIEAGTDDDGQPIRYALLYANATVRAGDKLYTAPQAAVEPETLAKFEQGYKRYEAARKLNPREWAELHQRNMAGEFFDDMVDALIPHQRSNRMTDNTTPGGNAAIPVVVWATSAPKHIPNDFAFFETEEYAVALVKQSDARAALNDKDAEIAALRKYAEVWRHASNEWADSATSGLQWLRNIRDGISTVEAAIANTEGSIAHCIAGVALAQAVQSKESGK